MKHLKFQAQRKTEHFNEMLAKYKISYMTQMKLYIDTHTSAAAAITWRDCALHIRAPGDNNKSLIKHSRFEARS